MKIGLVGGTGREGSGLAMRWARAGHEVTIGSRNAERGVARAAELSEQCGKTIGGGDNLAACDAEVVVVAFGSVAKFVRYVIPDLRERGLKVGFVRPITLWPFPERAVAEAAEGARCVAVFEQSAGQTLGAEGLGPLIEGQVRGHDD